MPDFKLALELNSAIKKNDIKKAAEIIKTAKDAITLRVNGITPLHNAVNYQKIDILKLFIENDVDLNIKCVYGMAPIHYAIKSGLLNIVKLLIQSGADVNIKDNYDKNPLYYSIEEGDLDIFELLIYNDSEIDICDKSGITPLHLAVMKGYLAMVEILLLKGANKNAQDNKEKAARDYAEQLINSECNKYKSGYFFKNKVNIKSNEERRNILKILFASDFNDRHL